MFRIFVLIIFSFLITNVAFAHENCIEGVVVYKNGEAKPVVGATVRILNTTLGAITNRNGAFHIKGIPKGNYELVITGVGLKPIHHKFSIDKELKENLQLKFEMEETSVQTADVVITATRSEKIYEEVPVKVSVISNKTFQSTSSVDIRDGLNFQPGLRTEINCQNCGFSQVRINGLDGRYSQILIDGNPIFSSLNGVYGLEQMPANMIDRIEVIRGGSSIYGGNAVAGIINIITKEPYSNNFNIDLFQSFMKNKYPDYTLNFNGSIVSENNELGAYIYGFQRDRKNWDANNDGFSDIGKLNVKTFGIRSFYRPDHKSKISLGYQAIYHTIRGGDSINNPPHQTNITEKASHNSNFTTLKYERYIGEDLNKVSVNLGYQNTKRESYYGSGQDPNAYGTTDNETIGFGVQYDHFINNFLGYHLLTTGYEYHYDWMLDDAPAYGRKIDQTTFSNGIFIQDDWNFTDWLNAVVGIRFEKHNKIDNLIISPRLNVLCKVSNSLNWRTSISKGHRPPQAFDEDLHITQVGGESLLILVDDNLKPEYSISFSSSVDYSTRLFDIPFAFSLEGFLTKLNDVFVLKDLGRDANNNLVFMRINDGIATIKGITFEVQTEISRYFDFRSSITIQQGAYSEKIEWSAGDIDNGVEPQYSDKLFKSPNIYGNFVSNINLSEKINISISGIYTGPMYIPHYAGFIEQDELKKTPQFFELGAKFNYTIMAFPQINLYLGMYNIFDSYQKDLDMGENRDSGYLYGPARPRTVYAGIKVAI